jgi:hypothetical protein
VHRGADRAVEAQVEGREGRVGVAARGHLLGSFSSEVKGRGLVVCTLCAEGKRSTLRKCVF